MVHDYLVPEFLRGVFIVAEALVDFTLHRAQVRGVRKQAQDMYFFNGRYFDGRDYSNAAGAPGGFDASRNVLARVMVGDSQKGYALVLRRFNDRPGRLFHVAAGR